MSEVTTAVQDPAAAILPDCLGYIDQKLGYEATASQRAIISSALTYAMTGNVVDGYEPGKRFGDADRDALNWLAAYLGAKSNLKDSPQGKQRILHIFRSGDR